MRIVVRFVDHHDMPLGGKCGDGVGGIDAAPRIGAWQWHRFGGRDAVVEREGHHSFVVQAQLTIHGGKQLQCEHLVVAIELRHHQGEIAVSRQAVRRATESAQ